LEILIFDLGYLRH